MHCVTSTTQRVSALAPSGLRQIELPAACEPVRGFPSRWGDASVPTTPAYWAAQAWMWSMLDPDHYRLGRTLEEELLACMLGGHGIPAEVGLAAYHRLRDAMLHRPGVLLERDRLLEMLSQPLVVRGRPIRYRFARQKADYLAEAFAQLRQVDAELDDRALRDRLTSLRGVGPKTASWVLRNLRGSDAVAILDVHILRAGAILGIFRDGLRVERNYREMEEAYLLFADAISTRPSILDSVIWMTMRQLTASQDAASADRVRRSDTRELPQLQ